MAAGEIPRVETPPDVVLKDMKYWDMVSDGMQQVLHNPRGTAFKVGSQALYRIAGKSGTAQVVAIKQGENTIAARFTSVTATMRCSSRSLLRKTRRSPWR